MVLPEVLSTGKESPPWTRGLSCEDDPLSLQEGRTHCSHLVMWWLVGHLRKQPPKGLTLTSGHAEVAASGTALVRGSQCCCFSSLP